jgi:phosphate transport system protein
LSTRCRAVEADLKEIAHKIAGMGSVVQQIENAVEALERYDVALAGQVIAVESQIDALERNVEYRVVVTIARRQPIAVDLRELVAALRIAINLEHIGHHVGAIARQEKPK